MTLRHSSLELTPTFPLDAAMFIFALNQKSGTWPSTMCSTESEPYQNGIASTSSLLETSFERSIRRG